MRFFAPLLLAAGLLGCGGVPIRDEVEAAQAPTAQQVAPPAYPGLAHDRTTLYIPPAYAELLNWDPAAFADPPVQQPEGIGEQRAESAASGTRAPRGWRYRGWRWRQRRQSEFLTVGLGMTTSPFDSGHAIGLPGQAVGLPGQAVGLPGQAVGLPGQAVGLPGQAVGLPEHAVGRPSQAVRRPQHAVKRPGQAVRQPGQAVKQPAQAVRRPQHPVNLPGHPVKRP